MGTSLKAILLLVSVFHWTTVYIKGLVPDEQLLFEYLMKGHQRSVRPVINSSTVVLIKFALRLNQIIDLNERKQVLTTDLFIDQEWTDENLKWAPEDFNGITSLRASAEEIWRPDTLIYNNADESTSGFLSGKFILLHHDGSVFWPVPLKLKSSCKVNIVLFPFDDQKCSVLFGSFAYDEKWVNYITMRNDTVVEMDYYIRNTEWQLLSVTLEKCITAQDGCSEPKASISLRLNLRRNTFYYMANIIVPCIMLSVLMLFTFWLPPTSTEKIPMGLSVFLTFFMFMLLVAEEVPATSEEVPLIGIYLCVVMAMTSVSVILGVIVINIYNRGMKMRRAPCWIRRLILEKISRVVRMGCDIEVLARSIKLDDRYQDIVLRKDADPGAQTQSEPKHCNNQSSARRRFGETKGYAIVTTKADVHCKNAAQTESDEITKTNLEDTVTVVQAICCLNKDENVSENSATVDKRKVGKPQINKVVTYDATENDSKTETKGKLKTDDSTGSNEVSTDYVQATEIDELKTEEVKSVRVNCNGVETKGTDKVICDEKEARGNTIPNVGRTRMEHKAAVTRESINEDEKSENKAEMFGATDDNMATNEKVAIKLNGSSDSNKLPNNKDVTDVNTADDSDDVTEKRTEDEARKPDDVTEKQTEYATRKVDDVTEKQTEDEARKPDDVIRESTYRCWTWENQSKRLIVAEWQQMAAVMDRFLFWASFCMTFIAYFTILVVIPLRYR